MSDHARDCPSRSVAEAIVRRVVPTVTVTGVVARAGGQLSTVYEVRCAEPDETLIVKMYADKWRWKLAKEVHVYRLLARYDTGPCPNVLFAESTGEHAFAVMTLLAGEPLSAISTQLDDADIYGIYRQLGTILSAVYGINQDSYGYLTTPHSGPPTHQDRVYDPPVRQKAPRIHRAQRRSRVALCHPGPHH